MILLIIPALLIRLQTKRIRNLSELCRQTHRYSFKPFFADFIVANSSYFSMATNDGTAGVVTEAYPRG